MTTIDLRWGEISFDEVVEQLQKLKHYESLEVLDVEDSSLEFHCLYDLLVVFKISQFGGPERHFKTVDRTDKTAIRQILDDWT